MRKQVTCHECHANFAATSGFYEVCNQQLDIVCTDCAERNARQMVMSFNGDYGRLGWTKHTDVELRKNSKCALIAFGTQKMALRCARVRSLIGAGDGYDKVFVLQLHQFHEEQKNTRSYLN